MKTDKILALKIFLYYELAVADQNTLTELEAKLLEILSFDIGVQTTLAEHTLNSKIH